MHGKQTVAILFLDMQIKIFHLGRRRYHFQVAAVGEDHQMCLIGYKTTQGLHNNMHPIGSFE